MPGAIQDEITRLQEEYSRNPEGRLFVHLAEAYRRSGDPERARELLLQGLQQHGDYLSARVLLAQVEEEMGENGRARAAWQEVLELDEENEVALRALAGLEERAGNGTAAQELYRRLEELGVADEEVAERLEALRGSAGSEGAAPRAVQVEVSAVAEPARPAAAEDQARTRAARRGGAPARREEPARRDEPAAAPAQTDAIGLTDLLVRLLEHRDSTFHADSSLTRLLAVAIGQELELDRVHLEALALGALLGDLGGAAFAGPAAGDPARPVAVTLQLLQGINLPAGVHEAVRHQHERWDGGGFPDGLRDEEIPYGARVLAVARACAQRLTGTVGGTPTGAWQALDELQREAGSRFDPVIVSVLRRVFQRRAEHGIGFGLGGRVILVHAEELRALGLATQLHSNGYVTETISETGAARTRMRTQPAEALVLGASTSGSDLARFIQEVRANPAWARMPVVVIDANDMNLRVQLLTAGADVCFPSEVDYREFKATLDALLRRREENPPLLAV